MSNWEWAEVQKPQTQPSGLEPGWETATLSKEEAAKQGLSGIITRGEEEGMMQPSPEQLAERDKRLKYKNVAEGKLDYYDLSEQERKEFQFYKDDSSPDTFMQRMGVGTKMTAKGKAGFIEATSDQSLRPIRDEKGNVHVYDVRVGQYVPFNPEGFDTGDVGEFMGESVPAAANIGAAFVPAGQTKTGQTVAGGIGSIIKQGISSLLPGEDAMSFKDRLLDIGISSGLAGATQGAINGVKNLYNYMKPTSIIQRQYQKAQETSVAKEGKALLNRMGETSGKDFLLDVAQETQDPWLMSLRSAALQTFKGKQMARELYTKELKNSIQYTNQVVDAITRGSSMDSAAFGNLVKTKFTNAVNSAYTARNAQATADYAVFNGNKNLAPITGLWGEIRSQMELYSNFRPSLKKGISIGNTVLKEENDMMTISKMVDTRRVLSQIAMGKGKLFDNLDPGTDRHIAKKLMNAIDKDLQMAGEWVAQPELKVALDTANKNYARNSEFIRGLKATVVGRALKIDQLKAGENISTALLRAKPSELKAILNLAEFDDPAFKQGLKEQYAAGLLRAGKRGAPDMPPGMPPFNPRAAVSGMVGKDDNFKLIFTNPGERTAFLDAVRFNQRISDIAAPKSGKTPAQSAGENTAMVGGLFTGNVSSLSIFGSKHLAQTYYGNAAAKLMFSKDGQQVLRTLAHADPKSRAFTSALTYFLETAAFRGPSDEEVGQQFQERQ